MRFGLYGTMAPSGPTGPGNPSNPPLVIMTFVVATVNKIIDVKSYMDQGYTAFDVMCIGAAGGSGGGGNTGYSGSNFPNDKGWGGSGGGGGVHKVHGLLAALPDTVNIVIGAGGNPGNWDTSRPFNPANTTDGQDGGASTFNGTTCMASGGKGGKRVQAMDSVTNPQSNGGAGGLGGTVVAGGGGAGDTTRNGATPGSWDPNTGIGGGGGGGAGGVFQLASSNSGFDLWDGTNGAGGAYNVADLSVYSPGGTRGSEPGFTATSGQAFEVGGFGGGASAALITGLATTYGNSKPGYQPGAKGQDGFVAVLLSAK